jgi:hypothetical protein
VVFIACIKKDISKLTSIVTSSGDISSLLANSQRSNVAPFQCCSIDLYDVLLPFLVAKTTFPMRYLNLPLSINILHMWIYNILRIKSLKNSSSDIGRMSTWLGVRSWFGPSSRPRPCTILYPLTFRRRS